MLGHIERKQSDRMLHQGLYWQEVDERNEMKTPYQYHRRIAIHDLHSFPRRFEALNKSIEAEG